MPIELAQNARSFSRIELLSNLFFLYLGVGLDAALEERVCATVS